MPLIRDNRVEDDPWRTGPVSDGVNALVLESGGDADAADGIVLEPDANLDTIIPRLKGLQRIEIRFPAHSDGRGFSLARRLRHHHGFRGELVARGALIADQYAAALQCGFDAVRVDEDVLQRQPLQSWRDSVTDFDHTYQHSHNGVASQRSSILRARHQQKRPVSADDYADLSAREALRRAIKHDFAGRIAVTTSFGVDAAVLLHLVAQVDPATPVYFVDTGKHFPETLAYKDTLIADLGLTNVRVVSADLKELVDADPDGTLCASRSDACCALRKSAPLDPVIEKFAAGITGRKRFQTRARAGLQVLEEGGRQTKLNPLAGWTAKDLARYKRAHNLSAHPLLKKGYLSVGCQPCTTPVKPGEDIRSGRWRNSGKTECGIHFSNGQAVRSR